MLRRDAEAVETLSRLIDACRSQPKARVFLPDALELMEVVHRRDPKAFRSMFLFAELLFLTNQYFGSQALLATIGPQATTNADFSILQLCVSPAGTVAKGLAVRSEGYRACT
jgi:hypothetical protein